tara:strand:+ start:1676 stop:1843 length:168 start_codon:yes stop_codon:yes gene_type:complete
MNFNFEDWVRGTYQHCEDPTEYTGEDILCSHCQVNNVDDENEICEECDDEISQEE